MKTEQLDTTSFLWVASAVLMALVPILPGLPLWLDALLLLVAALGIGLHLRGVQLPATLRFLLTLGIAGAAVVGSGVAVSQDAGAALLAAMLASKLMETHQVRDGRSACSFALFAVMAGFLRDQGPGTLLQALLACTLIVASLARLADREWAQDAAPARPPQLLRGSLSLLAISLPFAFVAFFLFPRFPEPLWGSPAPDDRARTGLSNDMSPGDIVEMLLDESPALRVTFETATPSRDALYWRGPVMSHFDGRRWTRQISHTFTPSADLIPHGERLYYEVMQEPTAYRYLIGLDLPVEIPEDARMGFDHSVFSPRTTQSLRRYRMGSLIAPQFQPVLDAALRQQHLQLPAGYNPRTQALMAEWKADNPDPRALIQRALALFNASFVYSLTPPPLARDSVDDFLFSTREGYCEHFASTFAIMMRSAGIPARVVTGYQGGSYNRVGDYWLIRNSDAHAWTEVWLEGKGWVRIDPTASVAPERIRDGLASVIPPPGALSRFGQPLWDSLDALRRGWNYLIVDFNAARQRALLARIGLDPQNWRQLGTALIVAIALSLGFSFVLLWRGERQRSRDPLQAAWQRLLHRLAQQGAEKRPQETASDFAQRLANQFPDAGETLQLLIQRYIAAQYAESLPRESMIALIADLRRFRPSLRRKTS